MHATAEAAAAAPDRKAARPPLRPSNSAAADEAVQLRRNRGRSAAAPQTLRRPTSKPPLPPPHADVGRRRHVTFSTQVLQPPTDGHRFPGSFSYTADHPPATRAVPTADSDFVDGSYFFNHLVRDRDAENYNMAEILRERSLELHRRQVFGRGWRPRTDVAAASFDRLSTSLPADYYTASSKLSYGGQPPRGLPPQDVSFVGGLEIEIPPRRHGAGLPTSVSADRLLMVPPTHGSSDPRYGYGFADRLLVTAPRKPTRLQKAYSGPPATSHDAKDNTATSSLPLLHPSERYAVKPRMEPVFNRYNVRTGQFEPSIDEDEGPEVPPHQPATVLRQPQSSAELSRPWPASNHQGEPRLSVSLDSVSKRFPQIATGQMPVSGQQDPSSASSGRKAVTWEDQEARLRLIRAADSEPHSGSVNKGFVADHLTSRDDSQSSKDDTRSSIRELGLSYSINDSITRSLSLSYLENVDQFALFEISTSKLAWSESFMGTNWIDASKQYKFIVLNRYEEILFLGTEEDESISNCILSPHKSSFKVKILDANGEDVVHFRRLYPVNKARANFSVRHSKQKYRLEVATPSGRVVGNIEKTYDSDTYYILEDRAGECLFFVQRSCICTCPLFWDYEFKILVPEGETEVGEISWSYLTAQNEQFNGTEISFPVDLNITSKIMLLGACFLLNFSRWQSSYLDSLYNPRNRDSGPVGSREENREVAALLQTSPEERHQNGFNEREEEIGRTAASH